MSSSLVPGAIVAGRYRLDRLLGQGGMGVVWAATHTITRRSVAMKFLKGPAHARPEMRRRFLREARAASTVQHPSVVEVHDVFELDDETPVMVMDLLIGETLAERLESRGKLDVEEAATILLPVVSAVGTAHTRGVVHRDLKPENIFLARTDDGHTEVKVLDFGIAKLSTADGEALVQSQLTGSGSMLGTPFYCAPEQLFGERHIDHRADIWALGVVLYECLSAQLPVIGENVGQVMKVLTSGEIAPLRRIAPTLPEDITDLVDRMLTRPLDQRLDDMHVVLDVLRRYSVTRVRDFGEARPQPPTQDPAQVSDSGTRKPSIQATDKATLVDPSAAALLERDTASPHAVSQSDKPHPRKIMLSAALAVAAVSIGIIGWKIAQNRDAQVGVDNQAAAAPASDSRPFADPRPSAGEPAVPPVAVPPASAAPAVESGPVDGASESTRAKVAPRGPAGKPVASKADGGKVGAPDPSKSPKRPGGLIEDVPF